MPLTDVMDPYKAATGWTPWSYFYAVAKEDEVALFWSTVFGAASAGSYIGSYAARGGYYASGGMSGKAFFARFSPIGLLLTSSQLQYELGAATDTEVEMTRHFSVAGDPSGSSMPSVRSLEGFTWESIEDLFE
ncbi:MAG: hypothetical protein [Circular genetic element sp.]|nr:MAG: hypothetical protein [Circular genetic element sp.]